MELAEVRCSALPLCLLCLSHHYPPPTHAQRDLFPENRTDTLTRWQSVVTQLQATNAAQASAQEPRDFSVNLMLVLDVSGSMAGKRINAMKLGICSLITSLKPTDRVYLMTFNSELRDISGGAITQAAMLPMLPALLVSMKAEGGTAFYDAILEAVASHKSMADIVPAAAAVTADAAQPRNVLVTLTDGEDTSSRHSLRDLCNVVMRPGLDNFSFMTVTVDMEAGVLRTLMPVFGVVHSKRIDVNVRTGRRLTSVFHEEVVMRMLQLDEEGTSRFYQTASGPVLREGAELIPPIPEGADADLEHELPPQYSAATGAHTFYSTCLVRSSSPPTMACESAEELDAEPDQETWFGNPPPTMRTRAQILAEFDDDDEIAPPRASGNTNLAPNTTNSGSSSGDEGDLDDDNFAELD
jgi:hypothetical protein